MTDALAALSFLVWLLVFATATGFGIGFGITIALWLVDRLSDGRTWPL